MIVIIMLWYKNLWRNFNKREYVNEWFIDKMFWNKMIAKSYQNYYYQSNNMESWFLFSLPGIILFLLKASKKTFMFDGDN